MLRCTRLVCIGKDPKNVSLFAYGKHVCCGGSQLNGKVVHHKNVTEREGDLAGAVDLALNLKTLTVLDKFSLNFEAFHQLNK